MSGDTPGSPVSAEPRAGRAHQLEVRIDRIDGALVLAPVGEIDITTGGSFLEALIGAISVGEERLIIDLTKVPFMDSTGFAIFLSARRALHNVDGRLSLVASDEIAEIFRLTLADKSFTVHTTLDDAVAALGG